MTWKEKQAEMCRFMIKKRTTVLYQLPSTIHNASRFVWWSTPRDHHPTNKRLYCDMRRKEEKEKRKLFGQWCQGKKKECERGGEGGFPRGLGLINESHHAAVMLQYGRWCSLMLPRKQHERESMTVHMHACGSVHCACTISWLFHYQLAFWSAPSGCSFVYTFKVFMHSFPVSGVVLQVFAFSWDLKCQKSMDLNISEKSVHVLLLTCPNW